LRDRRWLNRNVDGHEYFIEHGDLDVHEYQYRDIDIDDHRYVDWYDDWSGHLDR
jgi:hypothetical protein